MDIYLYSIDNAISAGFPYETMFERLGILETLYEVIGNSQIYSFKSQKMSLELITVILDQFELGGYFKGLIESYQAPNLKLLALASSLLEKMECSKRDCALNYD